MKYRIILADPPWHYNYRNPGTIYGQGASRYPCMSTDDLCSLPVNRLADTDCALLLWGTMPRVPDAVRVMAAWGFRWITAAFVWVKIDRRNNPRALTGNYTMSNIEVCWLGIRGRMTPYVNRGVRQVVRAPLEDHSRKPVEVRRRIEELFGKLGPQPRIELFARELIDGWDAMGDAIDGRDIREVLGNHAR